MPSCGISREPVGDTKYQDISASPCVFATECCEIRTGEVHEIIRIWVSVIGMKLLYVLVVVFFCLLGFMDFWDFFFLTSKYCLVSSVHPQIRNFHLLPGLFMETPPWLIQIQSILNILNLLQKNVVHVTYLWLFQKSYLGVNDGAGR